MNIYRGLNLFSLIFGQCPRLDHQKIEELWRNPPLFPGTFRIAHTLSWWRDRVWWGEACCGVFWRMCVICKLARNSYDYAKWGNIWLIGPIILASGLWFVVRIACVFQIFEIPHTTVTPTNFPFANQAFNSSCVRSSWTSLLYSSLSVFFCLVKCFWLSFMLLSPTPYPPSEPLFNPFVQSLR